MSESAPAAQSVVSQFLALLNRPGVAEQDCQDFLERYTELIWTPFTLNHGMSCGAVISKFPLGSDLVTDLAYVSKCSNFWHVVLIELEGPRAPLFRAGRGSIRLSSEFSAARSQLDGWREYLRRNGDTVVERMHPLLKPERMRRNPVHFRYGLVIGTNEQTRANPRMSERLATLQTSTSDTWVGTYDSLISAYTAAPRTSRRNVLRAVAGGFGIKHRRTDVANLLFMMRPGELVLTPRQRESLLSEGYDVVQWEAGAKIDPVTGKALAEDAWIDMDELTRPVPPPSDQWE
jgi:hypothetical protein